MHATRRTDQAALPSPSPFPLSIGAGRPHYPAPPPYCSIKPFTPLCLDQVLMSLGVSPPPPPMFSDQVSMLPRPLSYQIKSRCNEVMLHEESPLGQITLECFLTGAKNVFSLGFVPVKEDLVVLLARDVEVRLPLLCYIALLLSPAFIMLVSSPSSSARYHWFLYRRTWLCCSLGTWR
jgi:hypothetical protein